MDKIRLQKWISELGIASRREAEKWISEGRFTVNGQRAEPGTKIEVGVDQVSLDGNMIESKTPPKSYWAFYKPDNCLARRTSEEQEDVPTIYDLPRIKKIKFKLHFIGEIDARSEGLMILTTDKGLADKLNKGPKIKHSYYVFVNKKLTREEEERVAGGISVKGKKLPPIKINYQHKKTMGASKGFWYHVEFSGYQTRILRNLFDKFGCKIVKSIRYGLSDIKMPDTTEPGTYYQLDSNQIQYLKDL